MERLSENRLDLFVLETVAHLKARFPRESAVFDDRQLKALVRKAHADGKLWQILSAYDVRRLSECYLVYGPDFGTTERTAWARLILRRDDLSGREKMTSIANYEAFNHDVTG